LTEATAAVDDVVLNYSESGAYVDTITGFTTTATGDEIQLSLAALETAGTSGVHTSAVNFAMMGATLAEATTAEDVAAGAAVVQVLTTGAAASTTASVFVLSAGVIGSAAELEDALEVGGSYALAIDADRDIVDNAFIAVYTDGTDAHVASVRINSVGGADTDFEAGNLVAKDMAVISGVSSIASTTFAAGNFEWIA